MNYEVGIGRRLLAKGRVSYAALAIAGCCVSSQAPAQTSPDAEQAPAAPMGDAQPAAEQASKDANSVAELIVTATRIRRDGFEAPTPTTVIGADQINAVAPVNIADYVNQLPQLAGSNSPASSRGTVSTGFGGSNNLNLRALGPQRTLTMLDGRRLTPAHQTGVVDVNLIPASLVSRVEIVTGGASASWGSDAVAGVVNFILDENYKGLKGNIEAGQTTREDGKNVKGSLTFGTSFADGRGRLLLAGEASHIDVIRGFETRDWYKGWRFIANPTFVDGGSQPYYLVLPRIGAANFYQGGLITAVAGGAPASLIGTTFDPDGTTGRFEFGTRSGIYQIGGTFQDPGPAEAGIQPGNRQVSFFGRLSYDATDAIKFFVEASHARSRTPWIGVNYAEQAGGAFPAVTIRQDNAFLPDAIRAQMPVGSSFMLGRNNWDSLSQSPISRRRLTRIATGFDADLGGDWKASGFFQYGKTNIDNSIYDNTITARVALAEDAVFDGSGRIVCRINVDANPNNNDPNCAPRNVFGEGAPSAASIDYVTETARQLLEYRQIVGAAQVNGTVFSTWAGPVSTAFGIEARTEKVEATVDSFSAARAFRLGNFSPIAGKFDVVEGFGEIVVPLLSDQPFAKLVDVNAAGRYTHYSTSGDVFTWKLGLGWDLGGGLRLRATRSRDIRAPNMQELFAQQQVVSQTVLDPLIGSQYFVNTVQSGNPGLEPEKADTLGIGAVYRPSWLPGFGLSVDYHDIKIKGAIATVAAANIVRFCLEGNVFYCDFVTRGADQQITSINTTVFNANQETERGIDAEISYRPDFAAWGLPGQPFFRLLVTRVIKRDITAGGIVDNLLGEAANPNITGPVKWRGLFTADYELGISKTTISVRYIGPGVVDNNYVEGGNQRLLSINNNKIRSMTTVDIAQSFDITGNVELNLVLQNAFDANPPVAVNFGQSPIDPGTAQFTYDALGRRYQVGLRFKF